MNLTLWIVQGLLAFAFIAGLGAIPAAEDHRSS